MDTLRNRICTLGAEAETKLGYQIILLSFDFLMTELLSDVLGESRIQLRHASSLEEARLAVFNQKPQLLLIDWESDGVDTLAIQRRLRESMRLVDVPTILMTDAVVSPGRRSLLAAQGIRWILEKPIVPTSLPKLIKTTITEADINSRKRHEGCRPASFIHAGETASGAMWQKV